MPPPLNLNNLKIQDQSVMQTSDRGFRIYGGRGAVTAKNTNASLRNLPASTLAATTLGRPRTMRVVDNPEESRLKNINKHSQLDTTPNLDINEAWRKMIRKREPEQEIVSHVRYGYTSEAHRLGHHIANSYVSNELYPLQEKQKSPRTSNMQTRKKMHSKS